MSTEEIATQQPSNESTNVEAQAPKEEGVKVFAGNLSYKATDEDLKALFEPVGGEIISLQIVFRGQRSSGYGFVHYKLKEDADKAVEALNKKDVDGRELVVELAKPPQPKEKKPRAKKTAAARAPRAEDAVDGVAQDGEAAPVADGEEKPKAKRTRPPRRRGAKKDVVDGEAAEPTAEGETPAVKATRPPRKPKAAARIDEETGEPVVRAPRAPRAPREAPTGEPSKTLLFVANLPFTLDDEGLEKVFTDAGVQVATARIVKRKFGIKRSKGFGFVDTISETEQQKGLATDGTEVEGRAIAVKVALNSQQEPEGEGKEAVTEEQKEATA